MCNWKRCVVAVVAVGGLGIAAATLPAAEPAKESPAGAAQMQLPPGWTNDDLQKCMAAGMPGEQHKLLLKHVGNWHGKMTMWNFPGAPPVTSEVTATTSPIMDGKFAKTEMSGEMPGMGPFSGLAFSGYDNVSQKYTSTWFYNQSTAVMNGTGTMSSDGKVLTWTYTYTCPINSKPAVMREIETFTSDTTKTLESHATDPKSGKEYKMMVIEWTKK